MLLGLFYICWEKVIVMFRRVKADIQVIINNDPAARSTFEVVFSYSGLHAIWLHRIAHWLYKAKQFTIARFVSQISRFFTGIEIHPGAQIGERLFIDHGMGIVIGETCEIGNDVVMYHGVTLGGTGKQKGKRHPTVGNNVIIAAGAKVIGSISIGDNARIGANTVVLSDVPANSTMVGTKGYIVKRDGVRVARLDQGSAPESILNLLQQMQLQIDDLKNQVSQYELNLNGGGKSNGTESI
jgi:serine O-acetyltransferase